MSAFKNSSEASRDDFLKMEEILMTIGSIFLTEVEGRIENMGYSDALIQLGTLSNGLKDMFDHVYEKMPNEAKLFFDQLMPLLDDIVDYNNFALELGEKIKNENYAKVPVKKYIQSGGGDCIEMTLQTLNNSYPEFTQHMALLQGKSKEEIESNTELTKSQNLIRNIVEINLKKAIKQCADRVDWKEADSVGGFMNQLAKITPSFAEATMSVLGQIYKEVKPQMTEATKAIYNDFFKHTPSVWREFKGAVPPVWQAIREVAPGVYEAAKEIVKGGVGVSREIITGGVGVIREITKGGIGIGYNIVTGTRNTIGAMGRYAGPVFILCALTASAGSYAIVSLIPNSAEFVIRVLSVLGSVAGLAGMIHDSIVGLLNKVGFGGKLVASAWSESTQQYLDQYLLTIVNQLKGAAGTSLTSLYILLGVILFLLQFIVFWLIHTLVKKLAKSELSVFGLFTFKGGDKDEEMQEKTLQAVQNAANALPGSEDAKIELQIRYLNAQAYLAGEKRKLLEAQAAAGAAPSSSAAAAAAAQAAAGPDSSGRASSRGLPRAGAGAGPNDESESAMAYPSKSVVVGSPSLTKKLLTNGTDIDPTDRRFIEIANKVKRNFAELNFLSEEQFRDIMIMANRNKNYIKSAYALAAPGTIEALTDALTLILAKLGIKNPHGGYRKTRARKNKLNTKRRATRRR